MNGDPQRQKALDRGPSYVCLSLGAGPRNCSSLAQNKSLGGVACGEELDGVPRVRIKELV